MLLEMLARQQDLLARQQEMMEKQRQDMATQQATIDRVTEALVRALDRVGEGRELRDKLLEKKIAELQSEVSALKARGARGPAQSARIAPCPTIFVGLDWAA